ncbi:unnamed protein product [Lactuca saligna]|uniref:Dirigent protein n=1 Tax=Lactuca saligna TaxID=75948 RepID=A0AA35UVZ9_LACSI|nr:unnamed protein product [Lactuca saligna]
MNKEHVMLMLCTIIIAIPLLQSVSERPKSVQTWFRQELPLKKQKVTNLHFYFHDALGGQDRTVYPIFQLDITSTSITGFGFGFMFDNPMTVGPDPWLMRIGRGRGITGATALEKPGFLMNLNFIFTQGRFNGSTLQTLGTNPIQNQFLEMSLIQDSKRETIVNQLPPSTPISKAPSSIFVQSQVDSAKSNPFIVDCHFPARRDVTTSPAGCCATADCGAATMLPSTCCYDATWHLLLFCSSAAIPIP